MRDETESMTKNLMTGRRRRRVYEEQSVSGAKLLCESVNYGVNRVKRLQHRVQCCWPEEPVTRAISSTFSASAPAAVAAVLSLRERGAAAAAAAPEGMGTDGWEREKGRTSFANDLKPTKDCSFLLSRNQKGEERPSRPSSPDAATAAAAEGEAPPRLSCSLSPSRSRFFLL